MFKEFVQTSNLVKEFIEEAVESEIPCWPVGCKEIGGDKLPVRKDVAKPDIFSADLAGQVIATDKLVDRDSMLTS